MAEAVSVTLLPDERTSFEDAQQRRHTLCWHVLLDTVVSNGSDIARNASVAGVSIPVVKPIPSSYPGDPFAVCRTVDVQPVEGNRLLFKVTAQYSTAIVGPPGEDGPSDNPDPLQRPADVSWSFEVEPYFQQWDINGKPFLNSAMFPFDPPPQIDEYVLTLTIVNNEPTYNAATAYQYIGTVNEAAGEIAGLNVPVGCCLCTQISGTRQFEAGVSFWEVVYQFKIRGQQSLTYTTNGTWNGTTTGLVAGWDVAVLDAGYQKRTAGGVQNILDADDDIVKQPWPLNGSGTVLGDPTTGNSVLSGFVYVVFQVYQRADFTAFNFAN